MSLESYGDKNSEKIETIRFVEELIERNILYFEGILKESGVCNYKIIQFYYLPYDKISFENNSNYLISETHVENCDVCIKFTINRKRLMQAILDAQNKSAECDFFKELLSDFSKFPNVNMELLNREIDKYRLEKKDIDLIEYKQPYYYSGTNIGYNVEEESFVEAYSKIAETIQSERIMPGTYLKKDARDIIRKIQSKAVPQFEAMIVSFNKKYLHEKLLSYLAYHVHNKHVNFQRYKVTRKDTLSDLAKASSTINIIKSRENNRESAIALQYLIDMNLSLNRDSDIIANETQIKYLLAYAQYLIELQDCSDQAHYGLFDAELEISYNNGFQVAYSDEAIKRTELLSKRLYDNVDYRPVLKDENTYIAKAKFNFYIDTNVKFDLMLDVCYVLYGICPKIFADKEVMPDVFEVPKDDVIKQLSKLTDESLMYTLEDYEKALDYLTINMTLIKSVGGKNVDVVPVWDRENRDNRSEVKPLASFDNKLIFSPVVVFNLEYMWKWGNVEFYPPYEYGLMNYKSALEVWQSACQKEMESAIKNIFDKLGLIARKNVDLSKLDKKSGHPKNLGDYDIIAIDETNKIVWNIESKFLIKVGSIKEYYNHQYAFFVKDKKDEKFAKRIKYLEDNLIKVLTALKVSDPNLYVIKNYMVTNKVYSSELKKIDFEIITYFEFNKLVKRFYSCK